MSGDELRVGHGATPWHCSCHGDLFVVPSLAWACERRSAGVSLRAEPSST